MTRLPATQYDKAYPSMNNPAALQTRTLWFFLVAAIALVVAAPRPSARTDDAQTPTAGRRRLSR